MAESAGFFHAIKGFEDKFVDLNLDEVTRVTFTNPFSTLQSLYLPDTILGADLLVSLPKMKTHHWAGATLSMKNLFGIVPGAVYGWPKNVLHWAGIDKAIADLHAAFPKQFCLVDGIEAMEGNGPIQGTARYAGVVIGWRSSSQCRCHLLPRPWASSPQKLPYLQLAASRSPFAMWQPKQIGERISTCRVELPASPGPPASATYLTRRLHMPTETWQT